MIPLDEAHLKLNDLRQAITLEKQHRYVDLQGKRQRFSQFLLESMGILAPFFGQDKTLEALLGSMGHYGFMDLSGRMRMLEKVTALLDGLSLTQAVQQRPKTVMKRNFDQDPSQIEVKFVKGVGPRVADVLNRANVYTLTDLLYYFPRKYLDYHNRLKIKDLEVGKEATIIGDIHAVSAYTARNKNLSIISITVKDETGVLLGNWIFAKANRAMLESFKQKFMKGAEIMLSGKVKWDAYKNRLAMDRPEVEILSYGADDPDDPVQQSLHSGRIVPVYPLVAGLNLKILRRAIRNALNDFLHGISDPLPPEIRKRYQLWDLQMALEQVHFPETFQHYESARRRLVFDELFYIQVRLAMIRSQYKRSVKGLSLPRLQNGFVSRFLENLPFELTGAQKRVFEEMQADMTHSEPMYRLLQGDVGSGKTMIALLALLMAVDNGYQGALMAPTEILAEQHYRTFIQWLTPLGIKVGLFVGKSGAKERRELRQSLLNGQIHVAIGTHALIQEDVEFDRLGVVVVDEQHRFGVRQRILLKNKGENPEMLTMTATPIPRTLAMTLHGDLDVSILDELPPGRTPIRTALYKGKSKREQAYTLIRQEVEKGRQAYVVFPLIEESENMVAKAATVEYERLVNEVFPNLKIGLLHGKLHSDEKDAIMQGFLSKNLDILVSTTVIEVGVDVANATVMLIESADRFGLAQLHQLRGRVGRGAHQSYCLLLTDSRNEETLSRINILVECDNGFEISEKDMEIRGPGEFLGTRQSGLPDLVLADLIQDKGILEEAREAAFQLIEDNADLTQYPDLHEIIFAKTEEKFHVVNSG
jgi:ATP-dependent DNA helicase RecG